LETNGAAVCLSSQGQRGVSRRRENNTFSLGTEEYVIEVKSMSPPVMGRIQTKTPIVEAGSTGTGLDATFDLAVESGG
jgi:hypothetical protein